MRAFTDSRIRWYWVFRSMKSIASVNSGSVNSGRRTVYRIKSRNGARKLNKAKRSLVCHRPLSAVRNSLANHLVICFVRELVRAFVPRIAGVAFYPMPVDSMTLDLAFERLPKIHVLHRLAVGRAPVAPLPLRQPFRDALADVLGVCVERHCARTLERGERADRSGELHAIVRCQGLSAAELFLMFSRDQYGAPSPRSRVTSARAVGIDSDTRYVARALRLAAGGWSFCHCTGRG